MSHQKSISILVSAFSILLLSQVSFATDDPCINALGVSSPGQAAALGTIRDGQKKPQSFNEADKALDGEQRDKDNDAQWKRQWTGDASQIAGDWNTQAAPAFMAGAAVEMNPMIKATLMECYARRSAQGQADQKVAEQNKKNAQNLTREDAQNQNTSGYNANVIRVEEASLAGGAGR